MILDDGLNAPDHTEEDENYFISMTDMMVGVLFIFLIMLMLFALNFRNITEEKLAQLQRDSEQLQIEKQRVEEAEQRVKEAQQELVRVKFVADDVARRLDVLTAKVDGQLDELRQASRDRSELLNALRSELRAQGLDVQIDEVNGVLRLTENAIHFPVNRSDLDEIATKNVNKVATALGIVLPCYTTYRETYTGARCPSKTSGAMIETVFIEGHTDVTGGDDRNWPLATDRAVKTFRQLTSFAPQLRSLANKTGKEILSVSGYGSTRPIDREKTPDAYEKNRRIDLRFVMESDNSQRLEEIIKATEEMRVELNRLHTSVEQVQ